MAESELELYTTMGEEKLNATTHLHGIWRWVYPTFEKLNDLYSCDPKEENEGICLDFLHPYQVCK